MLLKEDADKCKQLVLELRATHLGNAGGGVKQRAEASFGPETEHRPGGVHYTACTIFPPV